MSKKRQVPEWIVWEKVLSELPGDIQSFLDLHQISYLDHTDDALVLLWPDLDDSGEDKIVSRALNRLDLGFRFVQYVRRFDVWSQSSDFYQGRKWRTCRYATLMQQGNWCRCCGRRPPEVELHVDHIEPRSVSPDRAWDLTNLQVMCKDCNLGKGNGDSHDWRCAPASSSTAAKS